ncbi:hypothetical protein BCR37DRAFT_378021 [Protomyces lactucae-debilis]|uniref:Uncharacterized protein n=1 Tax=Protomyces lactucae-debilis TaxID=2754530 RepID=A0A1Y2FM87_PROLT|nr:uncharacterized protein BCR37DRAFT_378021 [Protomyces lactucae-debilis]ORY85039.1 hypothetical protein BCR37DRAFT_378021 [Protomyces lactucae-debilis]
MSFLSFGLFRILPTTLMISASNLWTWLRSFRSSLLSLDSQACQSFTRPCHILHLHQAEVSPCVQHCKPWFTERDVWCVIQHEMTAQAIRLAQTFYHCTKLSADQQQQELISQDLS